MKENGAESLSVAVWEGDHETDHPGPLEETTLCTWPGL